LNNYAANKGFMGYLYQPNYIIQGGILMIDLDIEKRIRDPKNRDNFAKTFLFEHVLFNTMERELFDLITKVVLGTEDVEKGVDYHTKDIDYELVDQYVKNKRLYLTQSFFRYSRIFNLCHTLGITNIYDIGCQFLNQSFLLIRYSRLCYVGIEGDRFYLNDYRLLDRDEKNFYFPTTKQIPPAFAEGRISFKKGYYPLELNVAQNSIAIACSSIASINNKNEINKMASPLTKDFDRVIFNVRKDTIDYWKNANWGDFKFHPIGHCNFVFGTKYLEDIDKLRIMYPFSDGRFSTGICNFYEYNSPGKPEDAIDCDFLEYSDWN